MQKIHHTDSYCSAKMKKKILSCVMLNWHHQREWQWMPTGYCPPVQTQLVTVGVLQFFDLNIKNFKNTLELCACKQSINFEDFLFLNLKKRECYFFFLLIFCSFFSWSFISSSTFFNTTKAATCEKCWQLYCQVPSQNYSTCPGESFQWK